MTRCRHDQVQEAQQDNRCGARGAAATGAAFMTGLPLLGGIIGVAHLATHAYAVGDAYVQARKKA